MHYDWDMLYINSHIQIQETELAERFIHASGPGGQNVNKVATAVQLRFNIDNSDLDAEIKARLKRLAGWRLTTDGEIVIEARRYREQDKNRQDARERLAALVRRALERPKPRHKTRPTRASIKRRIEAKRKRGSIKSTRKKPGMDE
jgi:ribosome-associated protein